MADLAVLKWHIVVLGLAGTLTLSACSMAALGRVTPAASEKLAVTKAAPDTDTAVTAKKAAPSAKPGAAAPEAAAILGKMKEPMALARQAAFVDSLRDSLPAMLASGGLGTLVLASTLVSNNGSSLVSNNGGGMLAGNSAGVVANNGGSLISDKGLSAGATGGGSLAGTEASFMADGRFWHLLQAPLSLLPAYTRVREDVVMTQRPTGLLTAVISLYSPKTWNPEPGADNEPSLIDRFDMKVLTFKFLAADHAAYDLDLKVVASRRITFTDHLVLRQEVRKDQATGKFQSVRLAYLMGFDAAQPDGSKDRAELEYVAEAQDLAPARDAEGDAVVSYEPRRMAMKGTNSHGTYLGEVEFPPGGAIRGRFTHTLLDKGETAGEFDIQPDGASTQLTTSRNGSLALAAIRTADGALSLEVRDLAGPKPEVLPDVVSENSGIATFDLGEGEKRRARLF